MSEASFDRRAGWWLRRATVWLIGGVVVSVLGLVILNHAYPFPISRLKNWPHSPWVTDRTGGVMLTVVSDNGQWRFPVSIEHISPWLVQATIAVEDERFRVHCGVDPIAVVRAGAQNLAAGRVVSGASTLTMQICRMMDARPRTWTAKAIEAFRALQLERLQTKDEILATYLNMAPYGGNV